MFGAIWVTSDKNKKNESDWYFKSHQLIMETANP